MHLRFIILFTVLLFCRPVTAQVDVHSLRCESLNDPMGIDITDPMLSWKINSSSRNTVQTAYYIIVSSTPEKLHRNEGDIWNSGKVISPVSINLPYAGKKLKSRDHCFWKVKVYTTQGESSWSKMARWSVGLLHPTDWQAKWIGYDKASPWDSITQWSRLSARYFRKPFESAGAVKRATVYVSGLGLYELFINDARVGDQVLAPAPTDYRKSVLYNTYDVTSQVSAGKNVIAAVVGNGRFFTMRQNYKTHKHNTFGYPKLLLQLEIEYVNGQMKRIVTDASWQLQVDGAVRSNNEYDGEEYDATKELAGWNTIDYSGPVLKPQLVKAPEGKPVAQMMEPMRVKRIIHPRTITRLADDRYILDMGQNFSGWLSMSVKGPRGQQVKLRFAESLQPGGELYTANLRDAKVTDVYTLKGTGIEKWRPSFVYHGFRYAEVTGYPGEPRVTDFEGQLVFDDLATTGGFETSDSIINRIYRNAWWGIASNYKGMPVDCPQRNERQPWLGDRATGAGGEAFVFDNAALYAKWLDDIEQSQTPDGAIPDVAPAFWNYYSDNVTWPGTYLMVAEMLHRQYGDTRSIRKHYSSMKKWMDYMRVKYMKNFIMTKDKYGDWCVPPESPEIIRSRDSMRTTKGELLATATYYRLLQYMQEFATIAGKPADKETFAGLASQVRTAFNNKFLQKTKGYYDNNTVTANILPLYFGIVPDSLKNAVFNSICKRITETDNNHISTGVVGTQWLMRGLSRFGRPDISFTLATNNTYPSWGYMTEQGATTIWELWNGNTANPQMNSQNHVMLLGDLIIWYYENLAGIKSDDKEVAFRKIIMKPDFVKGLHEVNASYESSYGMIRSHWKKNDQGLKWNISIPANCSALVYVPAADSNDVTDGGSPLASVQGVHFLRIEGNCAVFQISSGDYTLTSNRLPF